MKVARGAMWGNLASCGGLAIRPPGVGAQMNFHERLSRVRRMAVPIMASPMPTRVALMSEKVAIDQAGCDDDVADAFHGLA